MKNNRKGKATPGASPGAAAGQALSEQTSVTTPTSGRAAKRTKPKAGASAVSSPAPTAPVKTRIEYLNSGAREVFVAGSFNQWNPLATALNPCCEGKWDIELALDPGRYEYRLVVDGQWTEDPKSSEYAANPFGGLNSVLHVEARS